MLKKMLEEYGATILVLIFGGAIVSYFLEYLIFASSF